MIKWWGIYAIVLIIEKLQPAYWASNHAALHWFGCPNTLNQVMDLTPFRINGCNLFSCLLCIPLPPCLPLKLCSSGPNSVAWLMPPVQQESVHVRKGCNAVCFFQTGSKRAPLLQRKQTLQISCFGMLHSTKKMVCTSCCNGAWFDKNHTSLISSNVLSD